MTNEAIPQGPKASRPMDGSGPTSTRRLAFEMRILLVGAQALVQEGLRRILEAELGRVQVGQGDPDESLALVRGAAWDVVVVDVPSVDTACLAVLRQLRHEHPDLPILVLTVRRDPDQCLRILRLGVHGLLVTDGSGGDFAAAIRRLRTGGRYVSPALASLALDGIKQKADGPLHGGLSDREYEILSAMGDGYTLAQIARRLHLSSKTISTYRARVLGKLGLESTSQLVRYALEHGLAGDGGVETTRRRLA